MNRYKINNIRSKLVLTNMAKSFLISLAFLVLDLHHPPKLLGMCSVYEVQKDTLLLNGISVSSLELRKILYSNWDDMCLNWDLERESWSWKYIGQLQNGCHIIGSDMEGVFIYSQGLHILKVENGMLTLTDTIVGHRGCQVISGEIERNRIFYHQIVSAGVLLDIAAELFPEFKKKYYNRSSKKGIGYGVGGYTGCLRFLAQITEEGKAQEPELISFHPAEGWPPYSHKVFQKNDLERLAFDILSDIDAETPEELKEQEMIGLHPSTPDIDHEN